MVIVVILKVSALLFFQPTPQRIRAEHAHTLEKYAWESMDETPPVNFISEDLFLLLQSVVVSKIHCIFLALKEINLQFQIQSLAWKESCRFHTSNVCLSTIAALIK